MDTRKTSVLDKKRVKEVAKIKINYAFEILATTQFDKALKAEIAKVLAPYNGEFHKYKTNGVLQLRKEGKLEDRTWLIDRYTEILGKECALSSEKRGTIHYLCDKAFLAVRNQFEIVPLNENSDESKNAK